MIGTVYESQQEALQAISSIHLRGASYQADLTYSTGGMWLGSGLEIPKVRMDLGGGEAGPRVNLQGDIRAIPLGSGSLRSVVVDLPFIHAHGKDSVMGQRFASYPSQAALNELHRKAAEELARVTVGGGILVWKCQDIIESSIQVWNHTLIQSHAQGVGFYALDLAILVKKRAMIGWNQHNQQHLRKTHSYMWVFRKVYSSGMRRRGRG